MHEVCPSKWNKMVHIYVCVRRKSHIIKNGNGNAAGGRAAGMILTVVLRFTGVSKQCVAHENPIWNAFVLTQNHSTTPLLCGLCFLNNFYFSVARTTVGYGMDCHVSLIHPSWNGTRNLMVKWCLVVCALRQPFKAFAFENIRWAYASNAIRTCVSVRMAWWTSKWKLHSTGHLWCVPYLPVSESKDVAGGIGLLIMALVMSWSLLSKISKFVTSPVPLMKNQKPGERKDEIYIHM